MTIVRHIYCNIPFKPRPEAIFGNAALHLISLDYYKGASIAFLAAMCLAWYGITGAEMLENPLPLFQLIVHGKNRTN